MGSYETFDLMANFVFVIFSVDLFFQKAHADNGKDSLLACLDIADCHCAEGLIEPGLDF